MTPVGSLVKIPVNMSVTSGVSVTLSSIDQMFLREMFIPDSCSVLNLWIRYDCVFSISWCVEMCLQNK